MWSTLTWNELFLNDYSIKLPWCFFSDADDDADDDDDDFFEGISELEIAGVEVIEAFRIWLHDNHPKPYKFVGLFLNTNTSGFEKEVKKYCMSNQHILNLESGPELLILHNYIESTHQSSTTEFLDKTYFYLRKFGIPRTSLPVILIIPYRGFTTLKSNIKDQSFILNLERGRHRWAGSTEDYITLILRCLFDSVESISSNEKNPINKLKSEIESRLRKECGATWSSKAVQIVNMPIIGTITKILSLM